MPRLDVMKKPMGKAAQIARGLALGLFWGIVALGSTGCVGIIYSANALSAASKLEEAKTLGAEELAEYEYFYAKAMLEKAQEEAADASYGDAIEFASIADDYAEKAIEHARNAHREAGR
jgi:hypothetical protein